MSVTKQGYVNGSDLLIKVDGEYVGHATSHTTSFSSETKDRAVKPVGTASLAQSLWKEKGVNGLSFSISFEGLMNYDETEKSFGALLNAWKTGRPVEVECMERGSSDPYLKGLVVIASLEQSAPAEDDASYSGSLECAGVPEILDGSKLTVNPTPSQD